MHMRNLERPKRTRPRKSLVSTQPKNSHLCWTLAAIGLSRHIPFPPGWLTARVPPTRAARNSCQARGHQPRVPPTRAARNSHQARGHQPRVPPRRAARNSRQARGYQPRVPPTRAARNSSQVHPFPGYVVEKSVRHPGYEAEKSGGHVVTTPFSGLPPKKISRLTTDFQRHSRTSQQPFLPGIGSPDTSEPPSLQGSSTFNPFPSHHPGGYTELGTPLRERRQPGSTPSGATLLCPLPRVRIPACHRSRQAARRPPAMAPVERCPKPRGLLPP
jgi:hypothetical protein